jgi:hypothetical protein
MRGTPVSRTLAFHKIGVAQTLNMFGLDTLMCDADVVWQRDPSHYFTGCVCICSSWLTLCASPDCMMGDRLFSENGIPVVAGWRRLMFWWPPTA